ncbi:hypothetical protein Clacol_008602 [Clathrus columnatus]|uniref:Fungal lipase-type domain-containing protein n=1 Tax=Clathrus columnatus TaxID=1419009 RepID=A0AAV5ANT6_9AGAM|nr:hypothetical protein Clacol_008602 [Clathrus columnatus]
MDGPPDRLKQWGHSLGAAYATLTYAELANKGSNNSNAIIGDLYAFGAPRAGLEDFAIPVRDAVHSGDKSKGSSWRIVNNNDFVTNVPLLPLLSPISDPFIHIDAAYEIYPDKPPERKPSEIGITPSLCLDPGSLPNHGPAEYYKSLVYTTTGKPPIGDGAMPIQWGELSKACKTPKRISFQKQVEVKCTFASNHGCVSGTITYGSFVGEITARGSFATPKLEGKAYIYLNSWKDLYKERNKCVLERTSDSSLGLTLTFGNGTTVGFVDLPISSQYTGEVNLNAGTCNWKLNRTDKVTAAEKSLTEVYTRVLGELFTA